MSSSGERPVRIPRARIPSASGGIGPAAPPVEKTGFHDNVDGTTRALRLLLLLIAGLLVFFLTFLALVLASPSPGVRGNGAVYAFLAVLPVAFAFLGYWLTLGRAPVGAIRRPDGLVMVERFGRRRRIPWPSEVRHITRYPSSIFSPAPTEVVELVDELGSRRVYLVSQDFFQFATV